VSFRLRILGRDDAQALLAANAANPLIGSASVSGLAELAVPAVCVAVSPPMKISGLAELADCERADTMTSECVTSLPPSLVKYTQTTIMLAPDVAAVIEEERLVRRPSCIVWLGYVDVADQLILTLQARDRRLDDRRLCVECAHAGPRWHCRKKQVFLTDVLQRCKYFEEAADQA
jgi:hypothetical protein